MSDLASIRLGTFRSAVVFACAFGLVHCGGAVEGDGTGGSGSTGGSSTTPTSTAPTQTYCYGIAATSSISSCLTNVISPESEGTDCVFSVAIPTGKRLDPNYLELSFDVSGKGKLLIPYVGALASCPTTGTTGGWYATNVTGGATQIGLCGCTCLTAKKYAVTLNVDCAGIN